MLWQPCCLIQMLNVQHGRQTGELPFNQCWVASNTLIPASSVPVLHCTGAGPTLNKSQCWIRLLLIVRAILCGWLWMGGRREAKANLTGLRKGARFCCTENPLYHLTFTRDHFNMGRNTQATSSLAGPWVLQQCTGPFWVTSMKRHWFESSELSSRCSNNCFIERS